MLESSTQKRSPALAAQRNGHAREPSVQSKFAERDRLWATGAGELSTAHTIHRGDARDLPSILGGRKVDLVVTSPPYWDLKDYASDQDGAQLGHIADRRRFLDELNAVWSACHDALTPGGRLCIVVGDVCRSRREHGRHLVEPLHAYIQVECQRLGFDPLAPIIWSKIANIATEVEGNGSPFLGKPYEPNAIVKNDIEFILLFRKPGDYRHPTDRQRLLSLIDKEDHRRWFQQVWTDVPGEAQRGHPAPFPEEIARRLIGMFSFAGDTVLDPFLGTGTTTAAAMEMHRNSIGIEIEPVYFRMAQRRLAQAPLHATVQFHSAESTR